MRSLSRPFLALLAIAALSSVPAMAQTVRFLEPSGALRRAPGQTLELRLEAFGPTGRAQVPFPAAGERTHLFVRAAGTQENLEEIELAGELDARRALIALPHTDANLIGLELAPRSEIVRRADWLRFAEERIGATPESTKEELRVRRVESLKLLVRVETLDTPLVPSATAQSKSGQGFELRPLADPTATPAGSDLPLRVYAPESEGILVVATHRASGARQSTRTRAGGIADIALTHSGVWMVEAHRVAPADPMDADFELHSTTLVFEVPEGGAAGGKR